MNRTILHCDLNNFYASVECADNPSLKAFPIAVGGDEDNRHGIVLAKNQLAKIYGVKTAEPIWLAKEKCPELKIVPPHYGRYYYYSHEARKIYNRYTNQIEPFGIDECWLDITGSLRLFGSGEEIANKIRNDMKNEIGLTISVGVSFNKIFAKLGSDLKKPDATTIISKNDFKSIVWHLPCEDILGVGKSTMTKLHSQGIYTIGEIANASPERLQKLFGKNGYILWQNANGLNNDIVCDENYSAQSKSIGNSTTCRKNLESSIQARQVFLSLAEEISRRLREEKLLAKTISISIKDSLFNYQEHSVSISSPTRCCDEILSIAMCLFDKNWQWIQPVRALGIRTSNLINEDNGVQISFFENTHYNVSKEKLESSVDNLRKRYGKNIIKRGTLMLPSYLPENNTTEEIHMPTFNSK